MPVTATGRRVVLDSYTHQRLISYTSQTETSATIYSMATSPKYLTGEKAAINEFIDKFDVRQFKRQTPTLTELLTLLDRSSYLIATVSGYVGSCVRKNF